MQVRPQSLIEYIFDVAFFFVNREINVTVWVLGEDMNELKKLLKRIIPTRKINRARDYKTARNCAENIAKKTHKESDEVLVEALETAIKSHDKKAIVRLFSKGADVYTAFLILVATNGCSSEIDLLLANGADINGQSSSGFNALMMAVSNGHADVVALLIEKGADINIKWNRDVGLTVLMMAAFHGYTNIVNLLLARGVDVNTQDSDGLSALMIAAHEGHQDVILQLLCNNADMNARNSSKLTPLMIAAQNGHEDIVEVLKEAGAKRKLTGIK